MGKDATKKVKLSRIAEGFIFKRWPYLEAGDTLRAELDGQAFELRVTGSGDNRSIEVVEEEKPS